MASINSDDMQVQLMAIFSVEAEEHLQAMNQHLLTLEDGSAGVGRERLMAELFREAHSLKGAARAVNLSEVEALAHELEDLFVRIKTEKAEPENDVVDHAYQTLDLIGLALGNGEATEDSTAAAVETFLADDGGEPARTGVPSRRPSEGTVRIATDKLDALMTEVGELLVAKIGAERRVDDVRAIESTLDDWDSTWRKLSRATRASRDGAGPVALLQKTGERIQTARRELVTLRRLLQADARRTGQITANLQDDVRRTRMLPISTVLEALPRMVRDLAHAGGKDVTLLISGGQTEVDRLVLEQIKDSLTHLLRNSVDHGIEAASMRTRAGKPAIGTISLSAQQRGDMLIFRVADDGTGIDVEAVRARAIQRGLLTLEAAAALSDRDATGLIFRSGLSTSPIITDLSGRGVGLDVVRSAVELLHGSVEVESKPSAGTTFSLVLPLSISAMHCLLVEASGQTFALPVSAVERVLLLGPDDMGRAAGRQTVQVDSRPVVLARLSEVLGLDPAPSEVGRDKLPVIVLGRPERHAAFLVDRVTDTHEVVVKKLPDPLFRVRHLAGATILESGRVAIILNPADLLASVERIGALSLAMVATAPPAKATILVVEDSITTRTLEKNILEAAGYRVRLAKDGAEGWSLLQSDGSDLVVTDVEMPVMDGIELTAKIRANDRHRHLPVVLVTSRDSIADRERGIRAGADAYIVKGAFDQDRLLETIRRLI